MERIRPYFSKLMSLVQSAFMPGRKGIDNVLIAQELFYALDKKKVRRGIWPLRSIWRRRMIDWSSALSTKFFKHTTFPKTLLR